MSVHSDQLGGGWNTGGSYLDVVAYTVPEGKRTIVKRLCLTSLTAAVQFSVYTVLSGGALCWLWYAIPAAANTDDHETWVVLEEGQELHVTSNPSAGGVGTWLISGSELDL